MADVGLLRATDVEILWWCVAQRRVAVTADSDSAMLVALRRASGPSIVLLRAVTELSNEVHATLLVDSLPSSKRTSPKERSPQSRRPGCA